MLISKGADRNTKQTDYTNNAPEWKISEGKRQLVFKGTAEHLVMDWMDYQELEDKAKEKSQSYQGPEDQGRKRSKSF